MSMASRLSRLWLCKCGYFYSFIFPLDLSKVLFFFFGKACFSYVIREEGSLCLGAGMTGPREYKEKNWSSSVSLALTLGGSIFLS